MSVTSASQANANGMIGGSSPAYNIAGAVNNAITSISGMADRNTAQSMAEADTVRKWQEEQNQKAMEFSAAQAQKNRDWQEYMSNTAHQREVADLKAAGLNPVLSAGGGSGAAVTSGATASGVTSSGAQGSVDNSVNAAISSILGTFFDNQNKLELANITAKNNLAVAEKYTAMSELVSRISSAATMYSADKNLSAASVSAAANRYAADQHLAASKLSAESSQQIAKWANTNSVNLANLDRYNKEYLYKNYPQTQYGTLSSVFQSLLDMAESDSLFSGNTSIFNDWRYAGQNGAGRK